MNRSEDLLLAAGFVQHTQSALVSLVSSLLGFLSSGQSFVSVTIGFVSAGLSTGSGVFGSGQTGFGFFRVAAATGGQNSSQSQSREFQNVVHRVPLKVDISIKSNLP